MRFATFAFSLSLLCSVAQGYMIQGFDLDGDYYSKYPEWVGAYKDGARFVTILVRFSLLTYHAVDKEADGAL